MDKIRMVKASVRRYAITNGLTPGVVDKSRASLSVECTYRPSTDMDYSTSER